ncbi:MULTISPECIES: bifunctional 2-polyprenyl-6-hydroxyphenol methylase/3-demethylubiquinol 3-O-methyltransferase UbiG [unclassified Methanoregula]|uniref:class I SAM-dependent methyltransferase n=1 Tax=unclassified Methanoregula TaxID=2649730 RepID=UPI0009CF8335|nr:MULTISPECIES: class I SAM-dependent methyltransferase [unclassified Methanoregula]OPX63926.1 MAG: bifunctional 3-demethylubiquinone-9 3-methyltransferase/ 2-octaprenyl-6-hydroxy phenol methylase [Methanoregula sp. PtaB.Bin085]OPY35478.1 MAG: bifunctional 3-demethylubiquinone-9 3-methyltransferase/ 2-octaprenyl-6-hydroxy phenol methylase [Methanoregula sp. PtaU1.Bin006]
MDDTARTHYDSFLAPVYSWMHGSLEERIRKNREFFSRHALIPRDNRVALDLGAGVGYQSITLAQLGFSVTAVDFCSGLLEQLRMHAGDQRIGTLHGDIMDFALWSGRSPALITCMGDTLTHLHSLQEAEDLVRRCYNELAFGGRIVLSLRDYSREPAGEIIVVPVQRDNHRIFLCRFEYRDRTVSVRDILYSSGTGRWRRTASQYTKIRIAPVTLARMLADAGFVPGFCSADNGTIIAIARKDA